jgi:hypothetical protein
VTPGGTEHSQSGRQKPLWHNRHVVECRNTLVVNPFVGADWNTRWDSSNRARDWRDHNIVENGDRFVAGHDEHWSALVIRGFQEPELALGYQGSASVIAMALARARSSSSADWGYSR